MTVARLRLDGADPAEEDICDLESDAASALDAVLRGAGMKHVRNVSHAN